MIDIDHLERRIKYRDEGEPLLPPSPEEVLSLIAEIKRLRKRCPKCGNDGAVHIGSVGKRPVFWIECMPCCIASDAGLTEDDAWASWSGEI